MIIQAKQSNESQLKDHQMQVRMIKTTFDMTGKQDGRKSRDQSTIKTQTIDTQPLLKLRLKNIIAENKQKIKIIDHYKKNMHTIYQNFEEIKQQSGIQQLEEITKTFLKQQDQNTFIYQYMNRLNVGIEGLKQSNDQIKMKIQQQREINKEKRLTLTGTPEQAKRKQQYEKFQQEKMKSVDQLKSVLDELKPKLHAVLLQYNLISPQQQFELTQSTATQYISLIEQLLHKSPLNLQSSSKQQIKDDVTKYTKLPPSIADDLKEKSQERLLEKEKLNEFAGEFWEKKRPNNKMNVSVKVNQ